MYLTMEESAFGGYLVGNIANGTGAKETKHWLQYRSERLRSSRNVQKGLRRHSTEIKIEIETTIHDHILRTF